MRRGAQERASYAFRLRPLHAIRIRRMFLLWPDEPARSRETDRMFYYMLFMVLANGSTVTKVATDLEDCRTMQAEELRTRNQASVCLKITKAPAAVK